MNDSRLPDRDTAMQALGRIVAGCDGVQAAMFALRDGRPYACRSLDGIDGGRLAAMTSSLAALGGTVLRELRAGAMDHLLVEGEDGKLVIVGVPGTGGLLVLAVLAERRTRLGLVLSHARLCARALADAA